jgi:hypothetical protein
MTIDDDHLYYGAAIIQIAEDPSFTAINTYKEHSRPVECSYQVNGDIGVYLKYRTKPVRKYKEDGKAAAEYQFHFNGDAQAVLERMHKKYGNVYIGLVCVDLREICCISYDEFTDMRDRRKDDAGAEDQLTIYVSLRDGSAFRAYVVPSGTKGRILGSANVVSRNKFPRRIFDKST